MKKEEFLQLKFLWHLLEDGIWEVASLRARIFDKPALDECSSAHKWIDWDDVLNGNVIVGATETDEYGNLYQSALEFPVSDLWDEKLEEKLLEEREAGQKAQFEKFAKTQAEKEAKERAQYEELKKKYG